MEGIEERKKLVSYTDVSLSSFTWLNERVSVGRKESAGRVKSGDIGNECGF